MKKLTILAFGLHDNPHGYVGGGWTRTVEIFKRAKNTGVDYVLVETDPTFELPYTTYKLPEFYFSKPTNILKHPILFWKIILKAISIGVKRTRKGDINLILSPVEDFYNVFPAYITSKLTKVPWCATLHLAPLYGLLIDDEKKYTSKLSDLFWKNRYDLHRNIGLSILTALEYYTLYRILRDATQITYGSTIEDLKRIDPKISVIEVFPHIGFPLKEDTNISKSEKQYDAIFAATLKREKGIFDLINAWSLVVQKIKTARLVIVGRGDEKIVAQIYHQIKERKLEKNIEIGCDLSKGITRDEVWSFMKKSCVLIHPSTIDSWSQVILEALSHGIPVITYDTTASRFAYRKCNAVIMVPVGDISGIAENFFLLQNYDKKLSDDATNYAKLYRWADALKSERNAYEKMLKLSQSVNK
jgi:glycosyltransferase involved in cell wall biosynthesis